MNCPACDNPITFLDGLRQPTPYRYCCPHCRTKFRIQMPGMLGFALTCMAALLGCFLLSLNVYLWVRGISGVLGITGDVAAMFVVEWAIYKRIERHGSFTRFDSISGAEKA